MLDVLMLFPKAADPQELDRFLSEAIPAMKRAPGLRSLRVSAGELMARGAPPPYSKVVEASFESLADFMAFVQGAGRREEAAEGRTEGDQRDEDLLDRLAPLIVFFDVAEA
jgi:hypothetical protein